MGPRGREEEVELRLGSFLDILSLSYTHPDCKECMIHGPKGQDKVPIPWVP